MGEKITPVFGMQIFDNLQNLFRSGIPGRAVRYLPAPPQSRTSGFPHTVLLFTASLTGSIALAICISTVNIVPLSLVHPARRQVSTMFLICSSVNRLPPSLLSGFHEADFPPFHQYYEALA